MVKNLKKIWNLKVNDLGTWFEALYCWDCISHLDSRPCKICLTNKHKLTMTWSNNVKEIF